MRSSKSRSRSKSNRQRSMGNIVNRVFDSSGPEGKVRGTPQQIIDKYNQLARDASLSNDRVAMENFQQHAEHYTRMLGEAQREQDARREQQEQQQQNQQRDRQRDRFDNGHDGNGHQSRPSSGSEAMQSIDADSDQPDVIEDETESSPQPDLLVEDRKSGSSDLFEGEADSGLVETPESNARPRARARKPRDEAPVASGDSADAAQAKPRRPRKPRKAPEAGDAPAATPDGSQGSTETTE